VAVVVVHTLLVLHQRKLAVTVETVTQEAVQVVAA